MRVMVTGGAGFIGSHIVHRLVASRHTEVVVIDNLKRGSLSNLTDVAHRVRFIEADIRNFEQLREAMKGCEVVIHLAAQSTVMDCEQRPEDAFSTNVGGTHNVLTAARENSVRRVVFASSREAYGETGAKPVSEQQPLRPKNVYGASKAAGEMYCCAREGSGLEVSILRLTNVYGPRDVGRVIPTFVNNAQAGRPLTLYGGQQLLDFVWIDAVAFAFCRAASGSYLPGALNIGSGAGVTIKELAHRIITLTNSQSLVQFLPGREAEVTSFVADITRAKHEIPLECNSDSLSNLGLCFSQEPVHFGEDMFQTSTLESGL